MSDCNLYIQSVEIKIASGCISTLFREHDLVCLIIMTHEGVDYAQLDILQLMHSLFDTFNI